MAIENITDQATATAALNRVRDDLKRAKESNASATAARATDALRAVIVRIRPTGIMTVDEMADAVGHGRNYIDSVWSTYGTGVKGKQTRVKDADADDATWEATRRELANAAADQVVAVDAYKGPLDTARAERDRTVAMVYASKILGPSAIAAAVGIDRNHVLRIARKAGLKPAWRANAKNQYTTTAK